MQKPKKESAIEVDGKCCSCGYAREKETKCEKRKDKIHCIHWWEGIEEND